MLVAFLFDGLTNVNLKQYLPKKWNYIGGCNENQDYRNIKLP